jgi:hypothetical protein
MIDSLGALRKTGGQTGAFVKRGQNGLLSSMKFGEAS